MKKITLFMSCWLAASVTLIPVGHAAETSGDLAQAVKAADVARLLGTWTKRGSSLERVANPSAKEIVPGIFEFKGESSLVFEKDGKFAKKTLIAALGGSGTWEISGSKLTLHYKDEDDGGITSVTFTFSFPDETHMVLVDNTGLSREYFEKAK